MAQEVCTTCVGTQGKERAEGRGLHVGLQEEEGQIAMALSMLRKRNRKRSLGRESRSSRVFAENGKFT